MAKAFDLGALKTTGEYNLRYCQNCLKYKVISCFLTCSMTCYAVRETYSQHNMYLC
jgi:hypothetical protein